MEGKPENRQDSLENEWSWSAYTSWFQDVTIIKIVWYWNTNRSTE